MGRFDERTRLNKQIVFLKEVFDTLGKCYYSAMTSHGGTKAKIDTLIKDRRSSSFPLLQQILRGASHIILDNPRESRTLINKASVMAANAIKDKENERKLFIDKMTKDFNE